MVERIRHHNVPSDVKLPQSEDNGLGVHTEEIMDGIQKIKAVASLVESAIIWRAQYIAWNMDIFKAETLLFRLIFRERSQNPQAMDLLARIYFQQSKYEKAKDLWNRASELQPGNPMLKRTALFMQSISKSPSSAIMRHKIAMLAKCACALVLLCLVGWGGASGYNLIQEWLRGPMAVQNYAGRFHYEYDSITKDMVYVPGPTVTETIPEMAGADDLYSIGFTRKKASTGGDIGRIEVVVERSGNTIKATGTIPNLYVRYLVEQSLWEIPGVNDVDLRGLTINQSYRVNRGESLWIIAKRLYGEGSSWTLLAKVNDLDNPNVLRIGQELSVPLGDEVLTQEP
ncbi:MAG: LysM peptidoglycan-binding domain-containing protein [Synergistaceae bacterium]|nr:LysM peptidoglycan-binding domain-containing protein [Synergistaceae bacterium]